MRTELLKINNLSEQAADIARAAEIINKADLSSSPPKQFTDSAVMEQTRTLQERYTRQRGDPPTIL